jgi:hypothetical protein
MLHPGYSKLPSEELAIVLTLVIMIYKDIVAVSKN